MGDCLTEQPDQAESKSYGDIFDEAFPHYLLMGMTPEDYWDGESWLKKAYRKAYKMRLENEERIADRNAWLLGTYIIDAFQSMAIIVNGFVPKGCRPKQYPKIPKLEEAEKHRKAVAKEKIEEQQMQLPMAMFQAMVERFNTNFTKRQEAKETTHT